jgi:hypothetical protein
MNRDQWARKAFVLHNPHDPLEDQIGHFTDSPDGGLIFHVWDTDSDAYEERLAAGPAVMPSQWDYSLRESYESGQKFAVVLTERFLAAIEANLPDDAL